MMGGYPRTEIARKGYCTKAFTGSVIVEGELGVGIIFVPCLTVRRPPGRVSEIVKGGLWNLDSS